MLRKVLLRLGLVSTIGTAIVLAVACGTDAVGIEACRQIESARCRQAPNCPNISLAQPLHPGSDVNDCIRFYNDACQHGLAVGDPGAPSVNACVAAINEGNCTTVEHPETDPKSRCAWLIPPAPVPDAAVEAEAAADAAVEAATD